MPPSFGTKCILRFYELLQYPSVSPSSGFDEGTEEVESPPISICGKLCRCHLSITAGLSCQYKANKS